MGKVLLEETKDTQLGLAKQVSKVRVLNLCLVFF